MQSGHAIAHVILGRYSSPKRREVNRLPKGLKAPVWACGKAFFRGSGLKIEFEELGR